MKQITYKVTDPQGLHARPAGMLVKKVKELGCPVTITKGDKTADAAKLFAVMGLSVKGEEEITFTLDGANEDAEGEALLAFLQENI